MIRFTEKQFEQIERANGIRAVHRPSIETPAGKRLRREAVTEHQIQVTLIGWVDANIWRQPELAMLFAIPNAGAGAQRGQAGKMRAEGVRSGVPDLFLAVARRGFNGLFIEMKTAHGQVRPSQAAWVDALKAHGYCAKVCRSFEQARNLIIWYLGD